MAGRSLSSGRFPGRPPFRDSATETPYQYRDRGHSMKKQSYPPRGGGGGFVSGTSSGTSRADLYSTPSRSPSAPPRAASRPSRFREKEGRERGEREWERGHHRNRDYDSEDRRNPLSEGRSYSHSSYSRLDIRSAGSTRERFDDEDSSRIHDPSTHARDVLSKDRVVRVGPSDRVIYSEPTSKPPLRDSYSHARDALSKDKVRAGPSDRGIYLEPTSKPLLRDRLGGRSFSHGLPVSPRLRRLDLSDQADDTMNGEDQRENIGDNHNTMPASRYEILGLKEEIKKKDDQAAALRREMDEIAVRYEENLNTLSEIKNKDDQTRYEIMGLKEEIKNKDEQARLEVEELKEEIKKKDDQAAAQRREMDEMAVKYEENVNIVRTKLVSTFKDDMQEMKKEWEDAFQRLKDESDAAQRAMKRLKDESDAAQRAMKTELNDATRARSEMESELNTEIAGYRAQLEEEKRLAAGYRAQLEEEKRLAKEQKEELQRSKEEDLNLLRGMYDEHLQTTKKSASDAEAELKDDIQVLLEENEKIKVCYENLENDLQIAKANLEELKSNHQKATDDALRWEKEAGSYEKEVASCKEELDDVLDCNKALEDKLSDAKRELERMTSNYQRSAAEKSRFEKEFNVMREERDRVSSEHNELVRKLDGIQEERALERRYTEALTQQRDNMNAIIDNSQQEIEGLKGMNKELSNAVRQYDNLGEEFHLPNSDASMIREELSKAKDYTRVAKEFRLGDARAVQKELSKAKHFASVADEFGLGDAPAVQKELVKAKKYSSVAAEFRLGSAAAVREELVKAERFTSVANEFHLSDVSGLREELAKLGKMKERLEALGRERERYQATVTALKVDLGTLHGGDVGSGRSLQEHMRLLHERWGYNESRLKQINKIKRELEESIRLFEENAEERDRMLKDHHSRVTDLEKGLQEAKDELVKVGQEKTAAEDRLVDREMLDNKRMKIQEELEVKCARLQDKLTRAEDEQHERESQFKTLEADNTSMRTELKKLQSKKDELDEALDKMGNVQKGLKEKLESAYYDHEEMRRELTSVRQDHENDVQTYEAELSKLAKQKEAEIETLKKTLDSARHEHATALGLAKVEAAESVKAQLRLAEDKHADQDQRNLQYVEQRHKDDMDELRARNKQVERALKEQQETLEQKGMAEIKRRGELAKQKQELEILRSKERHLETHVGRLEEHISEVVAQYEAKLQGATMQSGSGEDALLRKHVRELEKKLEISSAAMKQIGNSSILMEKENERLKADKNELKLKLKKLVDCAAVACREGK